MPNGPLLPGLRDTVKKTVARREQVLSERPTLNPWGQIPLLIAPHYRRQRQAAGGRHLCTWTNPHSSSLPDVAPVDPDQLERRRFLQWCA